MSDLIESIELEKQGNFDLKLCALAEYERITDQILDKSLVEETIKQIDKGEIMHFCARVTASVDGIELGADYLGGCFEENLENFKESGYLQDMIDKAIKEAQQKINSLSKYAKHG